MPSKRVETSLKCEHSLFSAFYQQKWTITCWKDSVLITLCLNCASENPQFGHLTRNRTLCPQVWKCITEDSGLLVGPTGVSCSGFNVNTEKLPPLQQMNVKTAPQVSNSAHEQHDTAQWGSNLQVKTEETKGSDGIQLVPLYTCEKQQDVQFMCGLYPAFIISTARVTHDRGM